MTTPAKHTPGPWVVDPTPEDNGDIAINSGDDAVAMAADCPERCTNARLIAASPDLLAALLLAHTALSSRRGYAQGTTATAIRRAIAKALGQ